MDLNTASVPVMAKVVGLDIAYDLMLWRPFLSWDEVACVPSVTDNHIRELRAAGGQVKLPGDTRTRRDAMNLRR